MTLNHYAHRLYEDISVVCPIVGVSIGEIGNSASVSIDFDPSATAQQQTDAQAVVNAFDWTPAAQETWAKPKRPTRIESATLDFGAVPPNAHADLVIPVPGMAPICAVQLSVEPVVFASGTNMARVLFTARAMVGEQVQVRCWNHHALAIANPASGVFRVICTNPLLLGNL